MKKFFSLFLAGACLAAAGCGSAPDSNTKSGGDTQVLNLYSWADNFSPDVLSDFEKKYNCKVNYDVLRTMKNSSRKYRQAVRSMMSSSRQTTWSPP